MKLVKPFKHVKVVEVEFYTKHGQRKSSSKNRLGCYYCSAGTKKGNQSVCTGKPIRRIREARLQEKRRHSYKKILKQQYYIKGSSYT
jgi:hypothetical protein